MSTAINTTELQAIPEKMDEETNRCKSKCSVRADIIAGALLSALFILTWALGAAPAVSYGHDLFAALDAGWRVNCGQRPHVDFYSPYGAVVPLLVGIGMRLANQTASGIGIANAILGLLSSLMAYRIARRNFQSLPAIVYAVFTFVLTSAPSAINEFAPSNGMYYTRWSFGLLAVILLECLVSDESDFGNGVVTGVACTLLFFVKLNMFLLGLGLIVPSLLLAYRPNRIRGLMLGTTVVLLPIMLYLKFNFSSIWHDYRIVLHAKSASVGISSVLTIAMTYLVTLVLLLILTAPIVILEKKLKARIFLPLMAVVVFLADVLSSATNAQHLGATLSTFFALFCAARFAQLGRFSFRRRALNFCAPIVVGLLAMSAWGWFLVSRKDDIKAYYWSCWIKRDDRFAYRLRFSTPSLESYAVFGGPNYDGRPVDGVFLIAKVNDGVDLLSRNSNVTESVAVLDFVNPLSFALKRPPNRGGAVFLADGIDFNDQYKPDPGDVFGSADIAMIPKNPNSEVSDFRSIVRNYGPYLKANFVPVAQSQEWLLWRRTK